MNWNRKKILQNTYLLVLLLIGSFATTTTGKINDYQTLTINKYIEQEKALKWDIGYQLDAATVKAGETIKINYTVLVISTSSVNFTFYHDERIIWSPMPTDYILAPGESYTQSFHLNSSAVDGVDYFRYFARVNTENQSAIVRWGYEIIKTNFLPTLDIIPTFLVIAGISMISIVSLKCKR